MKLFHRLNRWGLGVMLALVPFHLSANVTKLVALGKEIFSDSTLSRPQGISCMKCHAPESGYTFEGSGISALVMSGTKLGHPKVARNSQSVAYTAAMLPNQHYSQRSESNISFFWDGRAVSLEEQAVEPLYSLHEMNVGSKINLCARVMSGLYSSQILEFFPKRKVTCKVDANKVEAIVLSALAAFQTSKVVNRYSSKFDRFNLGEIRLSETEQQGLDVFLGAGRCVICHTMFPSKAPLFSDFSYHNIEIPTNTELELIWQRVFSFKPDKDSGRCSISRVERDCGAFKTPTLRNVTKKPFEGFERRYGHNGKYSNVADVIRNHVYPAYIYDDYSIGAMIPNIVGDSLSKSELDALVAFLKTLEDR